MIKASSTYQDKKTGEQGRLVILGLSDLNWKLLREGRPIHLDLEEIDVTEEKHVRIFIIGGKDEDTMRAQLGEWFELPKGDDDGHENG